MSIIQTIRCKLGKHQWREWEFRAGSCEQQRVCAHCQVQESRQQPHQWGEWEYLEGSCTQQRVCARCQTQESRQQAHTWGKWEYISEDSCEQQRVCFRCQTQETRQQPHTWGDWEYIAENLCEQQRTCTRCQIQETRQSHTWRKWEDIEGTCEQQRVCTRCQTQATRRNDMLIRNYIRDLEKGDEEAIQAANRLAELGVKEVIGDLGKILMSDTYYSWLGSVHSELRQAVMKALVKLKAVSYLRGPLWRIDEEIAKNLTPRGIFLNPFELSLIHISEPTRPY